MLTWVSLSVSASLIYLLDDLAAVLTGSIGMKYSTLCLDFEKKLKLFFENLHVYSTLTSQLINFAKTVGLWSARAIGSHKVEISTGGNKRRWVEELKYLGYWLIPKLSFDTLINKSILKIRQLIGMNNNIRVTGSSSPFLRKAPFLLYVLPLLT